MIRRKTAALALAMGLLTTPALAQAQFIQDSDHALVPEELFGSGPVKLEFADFDAAMMDKPFVPKAKLTFAGAALAENTEFSVTFTLSNATFAEPVSNADLMWGIWDPLEEGPDGQAGTDDDSSTLVFQAQDNIEPEVEIKREGGAKGSPTATFHLKVLADSIPALAIPMLVDHDNTPDTPMRYNISETRKIVFLLPDLNASGLLAPVPTNPSLANGRDVTVTTTLAQPKSGGTEMGESIKDGHLCGTTPLGTAPATVGCPVVEAVAVITEIANTGNTGYISLAPADERTVLVGSDGKASDPQRVRLATVEVVVAEDFGGTRDQDGDPIDGFTGDLAGSLAINVSSDSFNEGDTVYIDTNGNGKVDGREAFDIDDGVASDTVPLGEDEMTVYYVPNGESALKHRASFTTTVSTEFSDPNNRVRSAKPATAELKLHGIKDGVAKAYAIAPLGSTDTANVRVTCETSAKAGCNVFLDCKDQMGANTFGEAGATVGPGATVRWSQADIASALGLDEGWQGRLACDVLSTAPITVQILTRAAGVLVNNTAISEGGD